LGVLIVDDLKVSQQWQQACNKAAKALGIINRTIEYRDLVIFLRLYKSLVRPHLSGLKNGPGSRDPGIAIPTSKLQFTLTYFLT